MADFPGTHNEAACHVIDEMIRSAALELFQTGAAWLTPARVLRGSQLADQERFPVRARVRFSGAGGAGFLALGCAEGFQVDALGPATANVAWVVERAFALGRRIEKRFRQFGIAVRLEAPEVVSELVREVGSETPSLRTTHLFDGGNGQLFVHLDGQLDLDRIASAGDVPLRDEGDIILF